MRIIIGLILLFVLQFSAVADSVLDLPKLNQDGSFVDSVDKIESLGVVIDLNDMQLSKEALQELLAVTASKKIRPSIIYAIFPERFSYDRSFEDLVGQLVAKGALYYNLLELPKEIPVTRAPSWLYTTDKGLIIVDGFLKPAKFISSKNGFIERGFQLEGLE